MMTGAILRQDGHAAAPLGFAREAPLPDTHEIAFQHADIAAMTGTGQRNQARPPLALDRHHCRSAAQMAQLAGGSAVSACLLLHVTQIQAVTTGLVPVVRVGAAPVLHVAALDPQPKQVTTLSLGLTMNRPRRVRIRGASLHLLRRRWSQVTTEQLRLRS